MDVHRQPTVRHFLSPASQCGTGDTSTRSGNHIPYKRREAWGLGTLTEMLPGLDGEGELRPCTGRCGQAHVQSYERHGGENRNETTIGKEISSFSSWVPPGQTTSQSPILRRSHRLGCPATSTRKNHGGCTWSWAVPNWLKLGDERPAHPYSKPLAACAGPRVAALTSS